MESTLAGCASVFISATSAAATYWASMYPECSPPCGERKGGSPSEVSGFTRRSTRRSAMPASWARPIPSVSRTRPSTSPWKLPPLSTAPSAGKMSGLSETLPSSRRTTSRAKPSASRAAPWTCGMQRRLYASGTRVRLSRRHALPVEPGLALADETQGHVREGHQVPRRAQRSLLGHEGVHAPVQAGEQRLDDRRAYARGAPRERRGEQEHDGANLLLGEGRADAARMAQDEVPLELRALGGRDDDVLELADAGRDAVDRRRARREPLDEAPPRGERARRGRRQVDLLAAARA